jgi:hypothetical protein
MGQSHVKDVWRKMECMGGTDPYTTVREPTFVARFLLDDTMETEESVANVDVFVDLPTVLPGR